MTLSRRIFAASGAFALAVALAVPAVTAQDRKGPPPGPGGPGGPGRGGALAQLGLQRLDLTDAQREQIKTLVKEQTQNNDTRQKSMELERQLRTAVLADTPDTARIEQLKTAIAEANTAALAARVDLELQVAQILTPEQRAKAREARPGRGGRATSGRH